MNNMNHTHDFVLKVIVMIAMGASVAGCGGKSDEEKAAAEQAAQTKKVVKKVQPADPLAGMSYAVTGTKGTLPLEVRFELLDRPEPTKPATVHLAFIPTMDLAGLRVAIKAMPGLHVGDDAQVKFEAIKNGEVKEYKFIATPATSGILLANVEATVTRDTGDTSFTFSLPVPVAAATTPAAK